MQYRICTVPTVRYTNGAVYCTGYSIAFSEMNLRWSLFVFFHGLMDISFPVTLCANVETGAGVQYCCLGLSSAA